MLLRGLVRHFPDTNVRVSNRNVGGGSKVEIEELSGNPEDPFAQLFELEIGLNFILIQIKFGFADTLHVIAVVPRCYRNGRTLFVS